MQDFVETKPRAAIWVLALGMLAVITVLAFRLPAVLGGPPEAAKPPAMPSTALASGARPPVASPASQRPRASARCQGPGNLPDHVALPCESPRPRSKCKNGFCSIAPGCFIMGAGWCEWGRALHGDDPVQVTLTHDFSLGEHEVTQAEWVQVGLPNPSGELKSGGGDCHSPTCPVGNITWFDALEFANRRSVREHLPACYVLSKCQGTPGQGMVCDSVESSFPSVYDCRGYRLPTSAEWEYAARAGTTGSVYSGTVVEGGGPAYSCYSEPLLDSIAWYCDNAGPSTHPVKQKRSNAWGLYDVIGNAGEWVGSLARSGQGDGPVVDPDSELHATGLLDPSSRDQVAWRGGTWNMWPNTLRSAMVALEPAVARGPGLGLRLSRSRGGFKER